MRIAKAECVFTVSGHRKTQKNGDNSLLQKAAGTPASTDGAECLLGRAINHHKTHWNCLQRAAQGAGKLRNTLWICASLKEQ